MARANQGDTIHLTVAQALVKYLSVQYSEFDEVQRRLSRRSLEFLATETLLDWGRHLNSTAWSFLITSRGMSSRWSILHLGTPKQIGVWRPWRAHPPSVPGVQHGDWRRDGNCESPTGAVTPGRLLCNPTSGRRSAATGASSLRPM